jgi:hypothetical protein
VDGDGSGAEDVEAGPAEHGQWGTHADRIAS